MVNTMKFSFKLSLIAFVMGAYVSQQYASAIAFSRVKSSLVGSTFKSPSPLLACFGFGAVKAFMKYNIQGGLQDKYVGGLSRKIAEKMFFERGFSDVADKVCASLPHLGIENGCKNDALYKISNKAGSELVKFIMNSGSLVKFFKGFDKNTSSRKMGLISLGIAQSFIGDQISSASKYATGKCSISNDLLKQILEVTIEYYASRAVQKGIICVADSIGKDGNLFVMPKLKEYVACWNCEDTITAAEKNLAKAESSQEREKLKAAKK